jgi:hypothetical protein
MAMLGGLKNASLILALAALSIFATHCGTDHTKVRVINASPDAGGAPGVDVAVDGKTVITGLTFGGLSPASGYLRLTAGNRNVEFRDAATTTDQINANVAFAAQTGYTLLAVGKVSDSTMAALLKTDDNSAPSSGNIKLRVIHAAPDSANAGDSKCDTAPCLDVYIVPPGTDITNLTPAIASLSYQQASGYQNLAAGTYEVIMTDSTNPVKTRLIDQTYTLTAGQIRTLVTLDTADGAAMSGTPLVLSDLN